MLVGLHDNDGTAKTRLGAILRWNWRCARERLRNPANCPTCGTTANVRDHRYYGRMVVVTSNCACSMCAQGETRFWAVLIWNVKCWVARRRLRRKAK